MFKTKKNTLSIVSIETQHNGIRTIFIKTSPEERADSRDILRIVCNTPYATACSVSSKIPLRGFACFLSRDTGQNTGESNLQFQFDDVCLTSWLGGNYSHEENVTDACQLFTSIGVL